MRNVCGDCLAVFKDEPQSDRRSMELSVGGPGCGQAGDDNLAMAVDEDGTTIGRPSHVSPDTQHTHAGSDRQTQSGGNQRVK